MDKLKAKFGEPPFQLAQFYSLRREWMSIMSDISSGNEFDQRRAIDMIETMEALACTMDFDVYLTFPELKNEQNQAPDGLPWGNWSGLLRRDLHEDFFSFLRDIMRMKEMLFEASKLARVKKSAADYAAVCQYCNWIISRCGRGLHDADAANPHKFERNFKHLCAIDCFPNLEILKARSLEGCEFCRLLRDTLLSPGAIDYDYCNYRGMEDLSSEPFCVWVQWRWNQTSRTRHDAPNTLSCLTVHIWSYKVLLGNDRWDFCIESTDARLASELRLYRPPQVDALSPSNIAFIQQQLSVPRREVQHGSISEAFLPTRLVDLGVTCDSPLRLVDSSDIRAGGGFGMDSICKYATLSYCWGPPVDAYQQPKLTQATKIQFYKEIPLEGMTPVLHDVIIGDKTDWERHSNKMGQIFQHSYVTICTPASSSCMQGFLRRTTKSCRPSIQIGYIDEISDEVLGAYSLRPALEIGQHTKFDVHPHVFPKIPAVHRDLALSSWALRGWVFQERFLSPRQIIFGTTMLHVRQDEVIVSESGETSSDDSLLDHPGLYQVLPQMNSMLNRGRHTPDCWYGIVEQYRFMEWTEELDLFPALSGIAGFFEQIMHDQYLAGLWKKDLYCGLLWHVGRTGARSPSSLGELLEILNSDGLQIGPSWSWASRPDFFEFDISPRINTLCRVRTHLRPEFDLLNSSISVDGVNPLGRVQKASLKIRGRMVRLRARCFPNTVGWVINWMYNTSEGYSLSIRPDWEFRRYEESKEDEVHVGDDGELQMLMISSCCSDWPTQNSEYSTHHTLLEEAEDLNRVTYKSHYRQTFLEDSEENFDVVNDCSLCSASSRRRDVWGLLVYPAGPETTFYRVGVFLCRAECGGSDLFKGVEMQTLELL